MKKIALIIFAFILTSCASTDLTNRTDAFKNKIKNMNPLESIKSYQKKAWSKEK